MKRQAKQASYSCLLRDIGIIILLFCTALNGAYAAALSPGDIRGLSSPAFAEKKASIEKIAASTPPDRARSILNALQNSDIFIAPDKSIYIRESSGFIEPLSGKRVQPDPALLSQPVLNNRLKQVVQNGLADLDLLSEDITIRRQSINSMLGNPGQSSIALLKTAHTRETSPELSEKLEFLLAFALLKDAGTTADEKIAAVKILDLSGHKAAKSLLQELIHENDTHSALSIAATSALDNIEKRQQHSAIANNIFTGLSLGSILLLAAMGLAVIYGLIGIINMAHGEFLMLGAYATYLTQLAFRQYFPDFFDYYLLVALPVAFITSAMIGLLLEWLVIRHLYGRPLESLLATFGISLLLMQTVRIVFGAQNVEVSNPAWMSGAFIPFSSALPDFVVPFNRLIILGFAILVVMVLYWILNKSRLGLFIRAVTQNRSMAACVGIRTRQIDASAFALGTGIAGLGGVALSQIGNVGPDLGQAYIIDSFMAVVLGGVGQLAGTVFGAFSLGILSKLGEPVWGAVLVKIFILLLIIIFIQKRPQGLFAQKGRSAEA